MGHAAVFPVQEVSELSVCFEMQWRFGQRRGLKVTFTLIVSMISTVL